MRTQHQHPLIHSQKQALVAKAQRALQGPVPRAEALLQASAPRGGTAARLPTRSGQLPLGCCRCAVAMLPLPPQLPWMVPDWGSAPPDASRSASSSSCRVGGPGAVVWFLEVLLLLLQTLKIGRNQAICLLLLLLQE